MERYFDDGMFQPVLAYRLFQERKYGLVGIAMEDLVMLGDQTVVGAPELGGWNQDFVRLSVDCHV
jgi:hypothetical protein